MISELFEKAAECERVYHTAEAQLEETVFNIIQALQDASKDGMVHFNDNTGLPKFEDDANDTVEEFEVAKIRGGELYIKTYDDGNDYEWFCPFEFGKIDYIDLLSCLNGLNNEEVK